MICRVLSDDPCANCKYAEEWDYDDTFTIYRCQLDMDEDCDGDPCSQNELYRRENGGW